MYKTDIYMIYNFVFINHTFNFQKNYMDLKVSMYDQMSTAVPKIGEDIISDKVLAHYSGCGKKQKVVKKNFSDTEFFKFLTGDFKIYILYKRI